KKRRKTFRTKKEADAFTISAGWEVSHGLHTPDSQSITVAEAADLWLKRGELQELEPTTLRTYRIHVTYHITPLIGREKLSRRTAPRVQRFVDDLLESPGPNGAPRSKEMARKALTSLKGILSEAQRRGLVVQNVARDVRLRINSRHKERTQIPSKEEIRLILKAVQPRWRPLLVTAIFTGLRSSELRALTWDNVDFKARAIHVTQRADRWNKMGSPKSAAGLRDIPMTPIVVSELREWKLACPLGDRNLVFPTGKGNVENHGNIINRCLFPIQYECGILGADGKPKYGLHALRHFCASFLIDQGFSSKRIQSIMGHSSITMTYDHYGHLFPSDDQDQARLAAAERELLG
ncbi:MAG: tyrosine-type recombinase/integrase, partial [Geminicoccaceae bacterium]